MEIIVENDSTKVVTEATIKLVQIAIYREHCKNGFCTVRDYKIAESTGNMKAIV